MGIAVLPVDLRTLEHAMRLPEGYKLRDAHCDVRTACIDFLVESDEIATQTENEEMPRAQVIYTVNTAPGNPGYHNITGEVKIARHKTFGYPSSVLEMFG